MTAHAPAHAARTFLRAAAIALGLVPVAAAQAGPRDESPEGTWVSLFNGKDLEGWTPKITKYPFGENFAKTFRVEDGVLKVGYDGYDKFDGKFGHLFSKKSYSKYRLRLEYRFVGEQCPGGPSWAFRNSGVMIHCQPPETMKLAQEFPVCVEVQFLGGSATGERPTGNMCSPSTHVVMDGKLVTQHCVNSKSKTYRGDQWVSAEVEAHGNGKIKHIINGETVMEYEKPQLDQKDELGKARIEGHDVMISGGYIALQAESHPVEFRKIEIMELKD